MIVNDRNISDLSQVPVGGDRIESMSGHSKWSTIKHKKAIEDGKKGAAFTKIAKKIQIAAQKGKSGDPEMNSFLRTALEEARSINMPSDNVRRAIDKAIGGGDGTQMEEIVYEAYGPGGVGFLITAATDNRNRTGGEVKSILDKSEGNLGSPGSVSYLKNIQPVPMVHLGANDFSRCRQLIEFLEGQDDVLDVWTNLEPNE